MSMRFLLAILILVCASHAVHADTLTATRKQPLRESSHAVDIRIRGGVATYVVRRSFANLGTVHEEAQLGIQLPYGATVTGLRIRGAKKWHRGELMHADKARSLYKELTGMGPHLPRDPALLQWVWADRVHLHLFPIAPKSVSTVEYTLTVPTRYAGGRYILYYPMVGESSNLTAPVIRMFSDRRETELLFDGVPTYAGEPNVGTVASASKHPLLADLEASGSHKLSTIDVTRSDRVTSVRLAASVKHTFRGDLRIALVSPWGKRYTLHDQNGGSENHVRIDKELSLGNAHTATGTWSLIVSDLAQLDTGTLESWSLRFATAKQGSFTVASADGPTPIPDAPSNEGFSDMHIMQIGTPPIKTMAGRLARVDRIQGKQFQRLELDVAKPLVAMPTKLSVVFVIDLSKSLGEANNAAQLEIARAYLSHVPDARFQIVGYRRLATNLTTRFHRPSEFDTVVAALRAHKSLHLGNGSSLDRGLQLTKKLLSKQTGTRRVIVLGDGLLRPGWKNQDALRVLPNNAITHIISADASGSVHLMRLDTDPLTPIASETGGIGLLVSGARPEQRKDLEREALQLVRPIQIDHVEVKGADSSISIPETLREGDGLREMVQVETGAAKTVVVKGRLWSLPYRKVIHATQRFSRAAAGFVFSHDLHGDLSDEEQYKLAMYAQAVSPVTAYLAIEPGVRPSTAGIDERQISGSGSGRGTGTGFGSGGMGSVSMPTNYWSKLFAAAKRSCVAQHKPTPTWKVTINVHMTYDEIVDVGTSRTDGFGKCLVEAAWRFDLSRGLHPEERRSWKVQLAE